MAIVNLLQSYIANKSALLSEFNTSNAIGSTNLRWTAATWNTFVATRTAAQNIYNDVGASQIQVDAARNALYNARIGLIVQSIDLSFTGSWSYNKIGTRMGYAVIFSSGTLTLDKQSISFDVWVVGGGGGAGHGSVYSGAAGGAGGGYNSLALAQTLAAGSYSVSIGGGGAPATANFDTRSGNDWGGWGGTSSFIGPSISLSAGGGSPSQSPQWYTNGTVGGYGGSGGGGGGPSGFSPGCGGASGVNGGNGGTSDYQSGCGYNAVGRVGGGAGNGINQTPFRENQVFAGYAANDYFGTGGVGGRSWNESDGNNAARAYKWAGVANVRQAAANSGAGGGGGQPEGDYSGGDKWGTAGGSGIVMLRWRD